jgi:hypothetical protein
MIMMTTTTTTTTTANNTLRTGLSFLFHRTRSYPRQDGRYNQAQDYQHLFPSVEVLKEVQQEVLELYCL